MIWLETLKVSIDYGVQYSKTMMRHVINDSCIIEVSFASLAEVLHATYFSGFQVELTMEKGVKKFIVLPTDKESFFLYKFFRMAFFFFRSRGFLIELKFWLKFFRFKCAYPQSRLLNGKKGFPYQQEKTMVKTFYQKNGGGNFSCYNWKILAFFCFDNSNTDMTGTWRGHFPRHYPRNN